MVIFDYKSSATAPSVAVWHKSPGAKFGPRSRDPGPDGGGGEQVLPLPLLLEALEHCH